MANKIRIGKDIPIQWTILTNGEVKSLENNDLTVVITDKTGWKYRPTFTVSSNVVSFIYPGTKHRHCGPVMITLWDHFGSEGQNAVDVRNAFILTPTTEDEGSASNGYYLGEKLLFKSCLNRMGDEIAAMTPIAKPTLSSSETTYTGSEITVPIVDTVSAGYTVKYYSGATEVESIKDAGAYTVKFVLNAHYKWDDETADYSLTFNVNAKAITLTANSNSKTYDGTALTDSGYTKSAEFVTGEEPTVTVTGSQTESGTSANVITDVTFPSSVNSDNYAITKVDGILTVNKVVAAVTWKTQPGATQYAGKSFSFEAESSYTIKYYDGDTEITSPYTSSSAKDMSIKAVIVEDNYQGETEAVSVSVIDPAFIVRADFNGTLDTLFTEKGYSDYDDFTRDDILDNKASLSVVEVDTYATADITAEAEGTSDVLVVIANKAKTVTILDTFGGDLVASSGGKNTHGDYITYYATINKGSNVMLTIK